MASFAPPELYFFRRSIDPPLSHRRTGIIAYRNGTRRCNGDTAPLLERSVFRSYTVASTAVNSERRRHFSPMAGKKIVIYENENEKNTRWHEISAWIAKSVRRVLIPKLISHTHSNSIHFFFFSFFFMLSPTKILSHHTVWITQLYSISSLMNFQLPEQDDDFDYYGNNSQSVL
ncbi:hypothetical protein Lal_00004974 [Lupinus albus]|nr:hypothetical protein Lal_00004974 [Lupinus albus]